MHCTGDNSIQCEYIIRVVAEDTAAHLSNVLIDSDMVREHGDESACAYS